MAIAGLQHIQDGLCIFSKILDDADLPKMTIWRAAVDISHRIRALGYPVIYAVASDRIKGAPAFIKRFGLQSCGMSEKGELFIWNQ